MAALITASEVAIQVSNRSLDQSLITDELIESAQYKHIRPILTKELYYAVIAIPADYTTLIASFSTALCYFVYFELLPKLYVNDGEIGLRHTIGRDSQVISKETFNLLQAAAYQTATAYLTELYEHLEDNIYTSFNGNEVITNKIIGGVLI